MMNVTIHVPSFAAVHLVSSTSFGRSNGGIHPFQSNTAPHATEAKATSKNVMVNGVIFATTYQTEIDANARSKPDAANTAQYRFTERDLKSTEQATIARTATTADANGTNDWSENMKKPQTMVSKRPVSEYGARTPARSLEYAYWPASEAPIPASEAPIASAKSRGSETYGEKSSAAKFQKGFPTAKSARTMPMTTKLL